LALLHVGTNDMARVLHLLLYFWPRQNHGR
jgi:hypothetical protein